MTKRILALMLAVLLAVSCFALTACGGGEEEKDNGKDNTTDEGGEGNTQTPPAGGEGSGEGNEGSEGNEGNEGGEVEIPEVSLFEDSAKIVIGKTYNLYEMSFTLAEEVKYVSDNTAVATVDAEGIITGVAEGTANVTIYVVVDGKDYEGAKFPVTVEAPWQPTDPISKEAVTAKDTLTQYTTFDWYTVNVTGAGLEAYNVRNLETATAGPVEIWSNHLQLLFRFQQSEVNATKGADDMSTYNFYFDFYYRPYDENNDRGDYKKATVQPWSIYTDQNAIYRCEFYDAFDYANNPLVEGQLYEIIVVVREGETQLGYAESEFTWTDSCATFTQAAEEDPSIEK